MIKIKQVLKDVFNKPDEELTVPSNTERVELPATYVARKFIIKESDAVKWLILQKRRAKVALKARNPRTTVVRGRNTQTASSRQNIETRGFKPHCGR
jgi:AraC-like DNA-binding protein